MPPLTWRNVDAPSFSSSNDLLKYAGQAFNAGFDTLDKTVGDFQGALTTRDSNALMAEALKYQDPTAMAAALQAGTLTNGIDTRNLNKDSLDFLNKRVGDLYGDKQAGANLTGTNLVNDARVFDLGVAKDDRARLEQMRTLQPAAYDLMVNARTLASSGRPEDLAKARDIINNNTALFTNAGIDLPSMLGMVSGNETAFQSGLINNQNVRLAADWWKAKGVADNAENLVAAAVAGTASPDEAIRAITSAPDIDPAIKRQAVADLTQNVGSYYPPAISPTEQLIKSLAATGAGQDTAALGTETGFAPGVINNETGGNWNAINYEVGSSGRIGHFGRGQFSLDRLDDAKNAGVLPKGMTGEQFAASPPEVQMRVEQWHNQDIEQYIKDEGLTQYIGQTIGGVPVTVEAMKSMAHIGGKNGMKKFLTSGGKDNPSDINGSSIASYGQRFNGSSGGAAAPVAAPAPVDTSLPIPGTFSSDGNPVANPVPALPGTPDMQLATDIIQRSALADDMLGNQLQGVDYGLASKRFENLTTAQIVEALRTTSLKDVPFEAVTAAVDQAIDMGMSPAIAGTIVEDSLESRDLGGLNILGWRTGLFSGDQWGGPTSGVNAPRIDMDEVKAKYEAYTNKRQGGGRDISPAVARLTADFNNANVPITVETLNAVAAEVKAKFAEKQAAANAGKNINLDAAQLEYEATMAAIQALIKDIGSGGTAGSVIDQYSRTLN